MLLREPQCKQIIYFYNQCTSQMDNFFRYIVYIYVNCRIQGGFAVDPLS